MYIYTKLFFCSIKPAMPKFLFLETVTSVLRGGTMKMFCNLQLSQANFTTISSKLNCLENISSIIWPTNKHLKKYN